MSHEQLDVISIAQGQFDPYAPNLIRLVADGYGFSGDDTYLRSQAAAEYAGKHKRAYFVYNENEIVGSLSVSELGFYSPSDEAHRLWDEFPENIALKLRSISSKIFGVNGIVVLPVYKGKRLANGMTVSSWLFSEFAKEQNPVIVVGSTKNPKAVLSRSNIVSKYNMRSFYGFIEVSPPQDQARQKSDIDVLAIMNAYWKSSNPMKIPDNNGVYFKNPNTLLPDVPDVSGMPDYIQRAFQPVIDAQIQSGVHKTAVTSLISIRNEFFS